MIEVMGTPLFVLTEFVMTIGSRSITCYEAVPIWVEGHCVDGPKVPPHAAKLLCEDLLETATSDHVVARQVPQLAYNNLLLAVFFEAACSRSCSMQCSKINFWQLHRLYTLLSPP